MEVKRKREYRKYSKAEKARLIESYKNSGMNKTKWCKEQNLGLSTLHEWLKEIKLNTSKPNTQTWVPVVTTKQEIITPLAINMGKINIPVDKNTDVEVLAKVLKVLVEIC